MRKFISEVLLIMVTIVWGLAFIWQNIASKVLGPLTVVGIRSVIAVVFIILSAVLMPALYKSQDPKESCNESNLKKKRMDFRCNMWNYSICLNVHITSRCRYDNSWESRFYYSIIYMFCSVYWDFSR